MRVRYLITDGSYSSYGVTGLIEGAADLDLPALTVAFNAYADHGNSALWKRHREECGWNTRIHTCHHRPEYEAIVAWQREVPSFIDWLVREHGCTALDMFEWNTEDAGYPEGDARWRTERDAWLEQEGGK